MRQKYDDTWRLPTHHLGFDMPYFTTFTSLQVFYAGTSLSFFLPSAPSDFPMIISSFTP